MNIANLKAGDPNWQPSSRPQVVPAPMAGREGKSGSTRTPVAAAGTRFIPVPTPTAFAAVAALTATVAALALYTGIRPATLLLVTAALVVGLAWADIRHRPARSSEGRDP